MFLTTLLIYLLIGALLALWGSWSYKDGDLSKVGKNELPVLFILMVAWLIIVPPIIFDFFTKKTTDEE